MIPALFAGFCCAYLGIASLIRYWKDEKREYVLVTGKVVDSEESRSYHNGHRSTGYVPVIEYRYNSQVYRINHRVSSSKYGKNMEIVPNSKYHVGDPVELRVYADRPDYALINDKNNIRLPLYVGIPMTLLGAALLCVAVWKMAGSELALL